MSYLQNIFPLQGGLVMYPLIVVSVLCLIIFIERTLFLHKGKVGSEDFVSGIKNLVEKKSLIEALTLCEETPGPVARIVKSALLHYKDSSEQIRTAIQTAAIVEIPLLERRVGTLAALARVAPLLGFLGTLIAALKTLYRLEELNSSSGEYSRLLAEALTSSAFGIAIGIIATLGHHFLYGRVRALVHDFEWAGQTLYESLTIEAKKASISKDANSDG